MSAKPAKNLAARAAELEAQMQPTKPKDEPKDEPLTVALEWHHRDTALPNFHFWIVVSRHKWVTTYGHLINETDDYELSSEYAVGSRRQVKLSGADGWEWNLPKKMLDFEYWAYLSAPKPPKPPPREAPMSPLRQRMAMRNAPKPEGEAEQ